MVARDILKTWPAFMTRTHTLEVFTHEWATFYFSLGRGKPKEEVARLWWTHRGEIIGSFSVDHTVRNEGQLPKLRSLENVESEWQIKPDAWVAVCRGPFEPIESRVFHTGFRGWRYFDFAEYSKTLDAKVRL